MKTKRRALLALTVVALAALAVAVPVVAGTLGIRGMNGVLIFTPHSVYDSPKGVAQTSQDPIGRMVFTTVVNPYRTAFAFTAVKLAPCQDYALVNPYSAFWLDDDQVCVNIVAEGTTNKAGLLYLKGFADRDQLQQYDKEPWVSGAQLCLVPREDIQEWGQRDGYYVGEKDAVLYSVLGLPIVLVKDYK